MILICKWFENGFFVFLHRIFGANIVPKTDAQSLLALQYFDLIVIVQQIEVDTGVDIFIEFKIKRSRIPNINPFKMSQIIGKEIDLIR